MSDRSPELLIDDILEAADKILRYTDGMTLEDFALNEMAMDAVARNFEIIGEAANRLPNDFKMSNSHIDWNRIRGLRNRIVHEYFGVDFEIVWEIRKNYIPELINTLHKFRRS
jgi:uncharacterized protein with HEPN domain